MNQWFSLHIKWSFSNYVSINASFVFEVVDNYSYSKKAIACKVVDYLGSIKIGKKLFDTACVYIEDDIESLTQEALIDFYNQ